MIVLIFGFPVLLHPLLKANACRCCTRAIKVFFSLRLELTAQSEAHWCSEPSVLPLSYPGTQKKISLTSSSSYRHVWHFSIFMEYKIKHKQTAFCRCLIHGPFYKANMTVIRLYLIKYEPRVSLKVFTIRASRLWTLANYSAIKGGKNILATSFLFVTSVFLTNGWP